MFNFFKKKKKKQEELDASFDKVMVEIERIDDWENPKRIQHYILDSCEQIIATTKVIEKEKKEYNIYNNYLMDVSKITDRSDKWHEILREVITKMRDAERAKDNYVNVTHRLSDEQFALMERNEQFVVDDINQMKEAEIRQSKVRRDMQMLEATKSEHEIDRENVSRTRKNLKTAMILVFIGGMSLCILFMLLHYSLHVDMTFAFLALFLAIVLFMLYIFYTNSSLVRSNRTALVGLNRTISLLNVVRMKYANVTGSIRFIQHKYHVTSAHELEWMWESYMEEIRIRKKNEQDNEDYKYFYGRLIKMLKDLDLYDRKMWMDQLDALMDPVQMEKVKTKLSKERNIVKTSIEENTRIVSSERDEVSRLMREHDYYPAEIVEIISKVDQMCGLNINYHFRT